jgi:hypothetical protein
MPDVTPQGLEQNPELLKAMLQRIFGATAPRATPPFFGTTMRDPSSAPAAGATPAPGGMTSGASAGPSPTSPGYQLPAPAGMTSQRSPDAGTAWPRPGMLSGTPTTSPAGEPAPPTSVMSESEWGRAHPAPEHTPYVAPDLKHRMLEGLFAGMQEFGRPGAGAETVRDYLGGIRKSQEDEANYGATSAEAAHKRYMDYAAGQKAPLDIKDLQAQIDERQATAQKNADMNGLTRLYTKAVTSGDRETAQRYADAIGELRGQGKTETPFTVWRGQNPNAPVTEYFKAEQDAKGKGHTNPFEAFAYGSPEEKQAAQDFIAFEKKQGATYRNPGEVEQRYALYQKDPDAFKAMYGDRGGAQEQGQAARMLKFFDGQRKQIQGDFTLGDQEKQQKLAEIQELEKPYLDAAKVSGAGGNRNARGTQAEGPRPDEVEVKGPNGEHGYIPRANLAKATKRGWKQVQ